MPSKKTENNEEKKEKLQKAHNLFMSKIKSLKEQKSSVIKEFSDKITQQKIEEIRKKLR